MSLSIENKRAVVSEVSAAIVSAKAGVLADYRGMTVAQMTALRSDAHARGVWIKVVKNNLARRSIENTKFACLADHFVGPVILSVAEDPVDVAKVMVGFAKGNDNFKIIAGVMDGALIDIQVIQALDKLLSREELIAKLLGTLSAPIQKFVATLHEIPSKFVRTLAEVKRAGSKNE